MEVIGGDWRRSSQLAALALQCFLYTGVVYVVVSTLPGAGSSVRPLADAARHFLGAWAQQRLESARLSPRTDI